MILAGTGQSWYLSPRNGARDAIVSVLLALCIRCPSANPVLSLKHLLGSHDPYGDYHRESPCTFGARLAIPHTEQDWKLHEDLFQDACVNHNRVDADNDPVTRMHTPLSKSSAEGNDIQDHDCCNGIPSSTIVGYVACYSQSALLLVSHSHCL